MRSAACLFGILLSALTSLPVLWNYFFATDGSVTGLHFLSANAGYGIATLFAGRRARRLAGRLGSGLAILGLLGLAFAAPPAAIALRLGAWGLLGAAAAVIVNGLLYGFAPGASGEPPLRLALSFGAGCLAAVTVLLGAYLAAQPAWGTACLALLPAWLLFRKWHSPALDSPTGQIREHRLLATVNLAVLLYFQSAAEWMTAGWLPLFLIDKLGASPQAALASLLVFFGSVMLSRRLTYGLFPFVRRSRLLLLAGLSAVSGFLLLGLSTSVSAAAASTALVGTGCGPMLPVALATLDERFPFDPRFYNRIALVSVTGALSACGLFGYADSWLGMATLPLAGAALALAVLFFGSLLILERRLMGATVSAR